MRIQYLVFFSTLWMCYLLISCSNEGNSKTVSESISVKDSVQQSEQPIADTTNFTTVKWVDSTVKDLGKLTRGDSVQLIYEFLNTGSKPLVISSIEPTCGCTVPADPGKPTLPGKKGSIKVMFHTAYQAAALHTKHIFVVMNTTPQRQELSFNAEIVSK